MMFRNFLILLKSVIKFNPTQNHPTSEISLSDMDSNQVDEFILSSCETLESDLKNRFVPVLDAKTVAARFPEEQKSKIISILHKKHVSKNELDEIPKIIYKTYKELNYKAASDSTDIIREHIERHNLSGTDHQYLFFYDETQNDRKFWVKDGKFNTEHYHNFVLGGILYDENQFSGNCETLLQMLKLQPSMKELKFRYIFGSTDSKNDIKKSFKHSLNQKNAIAFLKWVYESEIYVHYWNVDSLYMVADELSEVLAGGEYGSDRGARILFGDILYRTIKKDPSRIASILYRYTYPNLKEEQVEDFWSEWISHFDKYARYSSSYLDLPFNILRQKLHEAKNLKKRFFVNRDDYIIMNNFLPYYALPFLIFSKSYHVFDKESHIMELIHSAPFRLENELVQNYKFVEDSKEDLRIQISDVLVGCLSQFFTLLKDTNEDDLLAFALSLNRNQKICLSLLCEVLRKSFEKNSAFSSSKTCITENLNLEYIMGIFSLSEDKESYVHSYKDNNIIVYPIEQFTAPVRAFLQLS